MVSRPPLYRFLIISALACTQDAPRDTVPEPVVLAPAAPEQPTVIQLPPRLKYKHGLKITEEFDRFERTTTIKVDLGRVSGDLKLILFTVHSGDSLTETPQVMALIFS